jgi:repressor LexA
MQTPFPNSASVHVGFMASLLLTVSARSPTLRCAFPPHAMKNLTQKQQDVLAFIEQYQLEHESSPTIREIRQHFELKSDNGVLKHLAALEKKGAIRKSDVHRGIHLLESVKRAMSLQNLKLPLLGSIPAGMPVTEDQAEETWISVAENIVPYPGESFLLKVRGDSMIGAGILDGDMVVVHTRSEPREGEIVVALIDNENTLKRLVMQNGRAFLRAENAFYPDLIPMNELRVQGVVTGLIRAF